MLLFHTLCYRSALNVSSDTNNTTRRATNSRNYLGEKEVFNIRDNVFTYNDAKAVCAAHGARLASLDEVVKAYKNGANWCSYGWSKDQLALYPIQKEYWAQLQSHGNMNGELM